jgi:hypothetical protein
MLGNRLNAMPLNYRSKAELQRKKMGSYKNITPTFKHVSEKFKIGQSET